MNRDKLERRGDEIAALFWRLADEGGAPSDAEQLRALAIYANATARMIEGGATVNRAMLERRLDAIAAEVAGLQPKAPVDPGKNPFAWLAWLHTGDLRWIEGVIERANLGIEPTPEEQAQWLALEADAIRRMLAGESAENGRQCHS